MAPENNSNTDNSQNKTEEPETAFEGKRIVFFDSFEEMNRYDIRQYARMSPEERLRSVYLMRKTFISEDDSPHPFGTRVYFKE